MSDTEVKNYQNFHLSIEIKSTEVSLLLVDKGNSKPISIEHLDFNTSPLSEVLNKSEIIKLTTPITVSCSIVNYCFTLIPLAIFQEEKKETYLNFSAKKDKDYNTKHNVLKEVVNCFGVNSNIENTLTALFPQITFHHSGSIFINSVKQGLHVNFNSKTEMEVVYHSTDSLVFYNRYLIENKEESLYYMSLIAEKLKLNLTETKVAISGFVDKNGETMSFWNQFIPKENTTFNEIEATQLNAISTHRYFVLHKQFTCV